MRKKKSRSYSNSRRGTTSATLLEVGVVGISAVLILVTFDMFFGVQQALAGDINKGSSENFDLLATEIMNLLKEDTDYSANTQFAYFIDPEYIIVAYNRDDYQSDDTCGREKATKPESCGEKACLCLYGETTTDDDFDDDGSNYPLKCFSYPRIDYIFTIDYDNYQTNKYKVPEEVSKNMIGGSFGVYNQNYPDSYSNLFIYGECQDHWDDVPFNFQTLFIEKLTDPKDEKTYIMIAYSDDYMKERAIELSRIYGEKTAAEYDKIISDLLDSGADQQAYETFLEFTEDNPGEKISEDIYAQLSDYVSLQVNDYATEEELQQAVKLYSDYLLFYPDKAGASTLLKLADAYTKLADYENAKLKYEIIISDYPKSAEAAIAKIKIDTMDSYIVAQDFVDQGYEEAIEKYSTIIKTSTDDYLVSEAHYQLGMIYILSTLPGSGIPVHTEQEAVAEFEAILDYFPLSPYAGDAALQIANIYLLNSFYDKACEYLLIIVDKYPSDTDIFGDSLLDKVESKADIIRAKTGSSSAPEQCQLLFEAI